MSETSHACASCRIRKMADKNPRSIFAKIWRWHTRFCPGWKSYQKFLKEKQQE